MARKITDMITTAFHCGNAMKKGNDRVVLHDDGAREMRLHGHCIAYMDAKGRLWVSSAGYETNTTKERLNGLLGVSVHQSKFQWHLNGVEWQDSRGFTMVSMHGTAGVETTVSTLADADAWERLPAALGEA